MPKDMMYGMGKMNKTGLPFSGPMSKSFPIAGGMYPTATMNRMGTPKALYKDNKMRKSKIMKQIMMNGA